MSRPNRWLVSLLSFLATASLLMPHPSRAVTQAEVEEACADHGESLEALQSAVATRDSAQAAVAELYSQRQVVAGRAARLEEQIAERRAELDELQTEVVEWAVESYMAAETEISGLVLRTRSLERLVTGREFTNAITMERVAAVDRWRVILRETEELEQTRVEEQTELLLLEIEADRQATVLALATEDALSASRQMEGECNRLYRERQAELAAAAAAEARRVALAAARRAGAAAGVGAAVTPGFICPMDSAATSFINDWGFPRSGGRTHRGTDVFAPRGLPVYAVADGVVSLVQGGRGGIAAWLSSGYGVDYYYAHFDGYASGLSTGQRVTRGQVIGFNGNTGNARTTPPHLHLQIHPNGRTSSPVNPFPTLVRACR